MDSFPVSQSTVLLDKWRATLANEVVHSPCKPIAIPTETLVARILRTLRRNAELHPEKSAVIEGFNQDRHLTYRQIHDQALSVAAFLLSRGFAIGDRCMSILPNCIQFPVIHLGVWAAGGVFVGARPVLKHQIVDQLLNTGASVVFTSEQSLQLVMEAAEVCPAVKTIVCICDSSATLPDGVIDFRDALAAAQISEIIAVSMDAPCTALLSSGTTGVPKAVMHTHRTFHSIVETSRSHFQYELDPVLGFCDIDWTQECQIVATSASHMLGFLLLNQWLLLGSTIILLDRFDEILYPQMLEKFKPRYIFVTPPIFAFLAKHPLGIAACIDSVELVCSSSAPLSQEISYQFLAHHPSVKYIAQGYAMTESGPTHLPLLFQEGSSASSGVIAANCQQKIVVPRTNVSCKLGEWGEICVKGPGVTVGYLNNPEATKQLFDDEGWLRTGDIGYLDEFGCIYIVDRVKELIKINYKHQNIQVSPAEIEGILLSHYKVQDVAIVGIPHENGGELVRAFVVKAEAELTAVEVEQTVAGKLAPYNQLTGGVLFVDAIPRTATGKILRHELREKCAWSSII